jgi:histidyl-tRNA synthetase
MSEQAKIEALKICYALRLEGIGCETDMAGRSFKAQMKYAGKQGIPYLAVIGDDELGSGEVKIKYMADGTETPVKLDSLVSYMTGK